MPSSTDNPAAAAAKWWCPRHIVVTIEGPEGPRGEVVIDKPFARLGRDRRSEIELGDAAVLPCHVYLHATNAGLYCAGFAPGTPNGWLLPSATLEVGPFRLRASLADVRPPSPPDPSNPPDSPGPLDPQSKGSAGPRVPRIRMFTNKSRVSHADVLLQRQLTLIGRQAPATWRIKHPTISRTHGAIVWDGGELWLIDFFSSNGTRLQDIRCDAGLVRVGQEFRVGAVTCCYLDIQPANAGAAGEHFSDAPDSSDSRSTRPPRSSGSDWRPDDPGRRVDVPQRQDAHLAPPHATASGSGHLVRVPAESLPPGDRPPPEAAQAAIVETRPLTGDTKFVDRPQRSLEDRLAAVEAELATQREVTSARAARTDSELIAIRNELERLEAALRRQRETDRDHRAQVAELRERVLRELAQIGEQIQLLRQACDARPWEASLARLADDTVRRCGELERHLQASADKLATVEGTMIARMAELRSRQDSQGERPAAGSDDPESVLSIEPLREDWPAPEEHPPQEGLTISEGEPGGNAANAIDCPPAQTASADPRPAPTGRPAAGGSPQWLMDEGFTHRLVDFQAKRERSAWQRRLLWTGAAVISALVIVLAASLFRLWFNQKRAAQSGTSGQQTQESKPDHQAVGEVHSPSGEG